MNQLSGDRDQPFLEGDIKEQAMRQHLDSLIILLVVLVPVIHLVFRLPALHLEQQQNQGKGQRE